MLTTAKYYTFLTLKDVGANKTIHEHLPGKLLLLRIFDAQCRGQIGSEVEPCLLEDVFGDETELARLPVWLLDVQLFGVLEHCLRQVQGVGRVAGLLPEPFEDRKLG